MEDILIPAIVVPIIFIGLPWLIFHYITKWKTAATRTRFYRDKRNGKLFGVCAGIADYTGFDVALVRVCFLAAIFMSGGSVLPFYFIAAIVTPTKPRQFELNDSEEQQFWQGVRASPARAARD